MPDTDARNSADAQHINLGQDHEVRYWTKALGITEERLRQLVTDHGNNAEAVRTALGTPPAGAQPV